MSNQLSQAELGEPIRYDVDYIRWEEYLLNCEKYEVRPTLSDYLIWIEEDPRGPED